MSVDKFSTLDRLSVPKTIGELLLTVAVILALSPYLGGIDLGFIKIPAFTPATTSVLRYLGPALVVLTTLLFVPFWQGHDKLAFSSEKALDTDSKYRLQNITDIVKAEAASHGMHINGLQIGDRFHINDLQRVSKVWFPEKSVADVSSVLQAARATAFSRKYAEPKEDEKLVDVSKISIDGLKPWEIYFKDLLHDLGVEDLKQLAILNVGIGNGYAEEPFLSEIHSFKAVDISDEALQYAKRKYPQMTGFVCPAEDLQPIPNNSVDLYLSLRTYQSTLFDRRVALHEAYRVLRNGGLILLSVPIMFLCRDGKVVAGLIPPGSPEPTMQYARQLVARIQDYLTILNFREVRIDERSPFEIFLSAKR